MKKALIICSFTGFLKTFLCGDIISLTELGYEITCIAKDNSSIADDSINEFFTKYNIKFIDLNFATKSPLSMQNVSAYRYLKKHFKENHYDIIHCHTPIVSLLTRLAAKRYRRRETKIIYTSHGLAFHKYTSKKSWLIYYNLEKWQSKFTDYFITINSEDFTNAKKMKCKNVFKIPGVGIDLDKFVIHDFNNIEYKKKVGIDLNKKIIISVGELSARKNHKIIIDALSLLENKSDYLYIICGTSFGGVGTADHLINYAQEKNVNLKLMGHRSDIPQILRCADISALPSIREGLGFAGVEALASGVPLIASDVQGIRDYVVNGENGFLCHPLSSVEFAEAIKKLENSDLYKRIKHNTHYNLSIFSKENSRKIMIEIYSKINDNK